MKSILKLFEGEDRRSIGKSNEVVATVLANPSLFREVFAGMLHADPIVRMRSADAVEKITAKHPEYLKSYKKTLLQRIAKMDQQEVRWHVAQLFSRLELTQQERRKVTEILSGYLKDKSKIVKMFSMQALADIAERDEELYPLIITQIEKLTRSGSPAMKSRGKKLLMHLRNKSVALR